MFRDWLAEIFRYRAIMGWAAEYFYDDSQNVAGMFLHNSLKSKLNLSTSPSRMCIQGFCDSRTSDCVPSSWHSAQLEVRKSAKPWKLIFAQPCTTLTKVLHLALELYGVAHFGPVDLRPTPELRGERGGGARARAGEAVRDVTCKWEERERE